MKLFKRQRPDGTDYPCYYGRYRDAAGKWKKVKLFTDKRASERRLAEFQTNADQRAAGCLTVEMDHAKRPISEHVADYLKWLGGESRRPDSVRIATSTLNKLVAGCGWKRLADITIDSVEALLSGLRVRVGEKDAPATASYKNGFIKRAKAFTRWLLDRQRVGTHVLAKLKRSDERNGLRRRARRAFEAWEREALLRHAPAERARVYRWLMLTGLRRNEAADLRWGDLRLNAVKPFIQLRPRGKTRADQIPLHPDLLADLRDLTPAMPTVKFFRSIPDLKTLVKDLKAAGIAFVDAQGLRGDIHAMRHTFCTMVCLAEPNVTKAQKLTRHKDVRVLLDIYAHLGLLDVVESAAGVRLTATGTDGKATDGRGTLMGQTPAPAGHPVAPAGTQHSRAFGTPAPTQPLFKQQDGTRRQSEARPNLILAAMAANLPETRPSTQAD